MLGRNKAGQIILQSEGSAVLIKPQTPFERNTLRGVLERHKNSRKMQ
jgi:hypothetical protein